MPTPDFAPLRRRIAETVAWCRARALASDPEDSLRTPALRPANRDHEPNQWGTFDYAWQTPEDPEVAVRAVAELARRRAEVLTAVEDSGITWPEDLAGGRLLICDPEDSDQCSLSEPETGGFIDAVDVPAWDTWVAYLREDRHLPNDHSTRDPRFHSRRRSVGYLLCWIPPEFIPLVNDGIAVNPVDCLFWAADYKQHELDTDTLRYLEEEGLLK